MRVSVFGTINAQGGVLCKVTKVIIDSCRGAGSIYAQSMKPAHHKIEQEGHRQPRDHRKIREYLNGEGRRALYRHCRRPLQVFRRGARQPLRQYRFP